MNLTRQLWNLLQYGAVLTLLSQWNGAIKILQEAHGLAPADPKPLHSLAQAYLRSGNWKEAIETGELAVETHEDPESLLNLATAFKCICPFI
eukprot:TRINITY_DN15229_c0_g1_i1.p1 TRINITY_DN15229_c0_g1~~TRINITY_DN15229_c0_g1_i1.p1  ORF type:complete len:92 (+),score=11.62 TRINITY_DN15229_c0_g1_i1:144-419(+)